MREREGEIVGGKKVLCRREELINLISDGRDEESSKPFQPVTIKEPTETARILRRFDASSLEGRPGSPALSGAPPAAHFLSGMSVTSPLSLSTLSQERSPLFLLLLFKEEKGNLEHPIRQSVT